jgi:hypothetical protein
MRADAEPLPDLLKFAGQALRVPEKPLFFVETLTFPLAGGIEAVMLLIFESWIGPEQFVATPAPAFSFCHRRIPPVGRIIDATDQGENQDWIEGILGRKESLSTVSTELTKERKKEAKKERKRYDYCFLSQRTKTSPPNWQGAVKTSQ